MRYNQSTGRYEAPYRNIPINPVNSPQTFTRKMSKENQRPFVFIGTISQRLLRQLQYLCILVLLGVIFYIISNVNFVYPLQTLYNTGLIVNSILLLIGVFFAWKLFRNELRFRFRIKTSREYFPDSQQVLPVDIPNKENYQSKTSLFPMVGLILAFPFVILNLIYLTVAWTSGTGETHIFWNHFGEIWVELFLMYGSFFVIFIALVIAIKNYRR